ncbi:MAG: hypothetical protein BWX72_01155 [Firmicutes bacterium ADurb.Bin080]|nr:MAG: hypothetical protein BWX72_01155 [Firmicutes bacterium ADurb.Bin080]
MLNNKLTKTLISGLILVLFLLVVFAVASSSINPYIRDTFSKLSNDVVGSPSLINPELTALADKSGGGATPRVTNTASLVSSWTDTGSKKRLVYSLNSITFDSSNVSYYRTSGSGANCGITAGTGSFTAGETEKHMGYSPKLYVVAYLQLDSNLTTIRDTSTLSVTFAGSVSGDQDLHYGVIPTNTLKTATSSWPDNNTRTATISSGINYLALTFYTKSGWNYQTRISASGMSLTFESTDRTAPGASLTGSSSYNDGGGAMNYATSSSAGFSATDANVGVYQVVLQRQAFNASSYSDVYTKVGSTVTLSEAGYGSSFADYRIVAYDRVGNTTTSAVLRNWIPTLKVTDTGASGGATTATITGGTQYLGTGTTATTTSTTRYPGQTFYLRAKPNLGYLFDGFDIEYSSLNSGFSNTLTYSYTSISYDTATGFFNCAIVLSDNLCDLDNTYTSIAFRAKFAASGVVAPGYLVPYVNTYSGVAQPYPSTDSNYLSVGSIGSDREAVVTNYKSTLGSWTATVPTIADTYDIRVVVRNKTTTSIIYGTYEFNDCMTISRKEVTITFVSSNKTYDGNTSAAIVTKSLSGGIAADSLAISGGTASFADKIVGNGKTVTLSGFTITGSNLNCYIYKTNLNDVINLDTQAAQGGLGIKTSSHNILTYTGASLGLKLKSEHANKSKVYDALDNVDAAWFEVVISGVISGDSVSWVSDPYPTATMYGKTVGSYYFSSSNVKLAGTDVSNYTIQSKTWNVNMTYTADSENAGTGYNKITVTPKPIGISITANNKVYDGTTSATGSCTVDPVVPGSGDSIILNSGITYAFSDKHVGTGKTVTASGISVNTGASVGYGNYTFSAANNTNTANISKKNITISMSCTGKVYDGNTSVNVSTLSFTYTGIVASDATDAPNGIANPTWIKMNPSVTFAYADKNVSGNVTVSATNTLALDGTSKDNYNITNSGLSCTTSITQKTIVGNVTIAPISDIVFDTDPHQPQPTITDNALSPYTLSLSDFTFSYAAPPTNVGTYTCNISGTGNYTGSLNTTFKIIKANVTISADNISVVYGTNVDSNSIIGSAINASAPSVVLSGGSFSFDASKPMPLTPQVSASGSYYVKYTLSGANASNYNAPSNITITLTVSKRPITVSATAETQVFGEPAKELKWTSVDPNNQLSNGIIGSDNLGVALECDKNIGVGRTHADVGVYTIVRDTSVPLNANYNVTFNNANYTIVTRSISLTPNGNQSKIYGYSDPTFTYTLADVYTTTNTLTSVLSDCPVSGILAREAEAFLGGSGNRPGENVGQYRITQHTLTSENNTNYDIQFSTTPVGFAIVKRNVQITAPTLSSVYGETLLPFEYSLTSGTLYSDDTLTGSFSRTLNAQSTTETTSLNVGVYVLKDNLTPASSFGLAANNPNYDISQITNGSYSITSRPITVTPTPGLAKTYGVQDPILTYSLSYTGDPEKPALIGTDALTGALTRVSGNNAGTYAISKGTLANSNYTITASPEIFTINPLGIVVLAKLWSMDYAVPIKQHSELTWTTTPASLPYGDTLTGQLYLDPAQWTIDEFGAVPVGVYDISQGSVTNGNNPNYSITFNGTSRYVINMLVANIKPLAGQTTTYGTTLDQLYTSGLSFMAYTNGGVQIAASYFSGKLHLDTAVSVPTPGSYEIVQGTLDSATHVINMNYEKNIYNVIAQCPPTYLTVNKRNLSIQPTEVSQVFGEAEVSELPFTIASGSLIGTDQLTGSLLRESSGSSLTVGSYNIYIGDVANSYYNLTIVNNLGKYKVTKRPITILPNPASSIYGYAEEGITYTISLRDGFVSSNPPIIEGYNLSGSLSRATNNIMFVGDYPIIIGTLNNPNYDIILDSSTVYYSINKRPISVKAENKTQVFGNAPTSLSYIFTGGTRPATWDGGTLSPITQLSRETGSTVGTYEITAGNMLDEGVNPNYQITFTSGTYTITPRPITITPASNQTKEYGQPDPVFTYTVTGAQGGLVSGYPLTGLLSRETGEAVGGYRITQGTIDNSEGQNSNYLITFNDIISFGITQASSVISFNDGTQLVEGQYVLALIYNASVQSIDASLSHSETSINYSIDNSFRNVGTYSVTLSSLPTRNYKSTSVAVTVEISPYELENILATEIIDEMSNLTKIYGETDKTFVKSIVGLGDDSDIIVEYTRETGEAVGLYDLELSSFSNSNYVVTLAPNAGNDVFEITKREITISEVTPVSKFYDGVAEASKSINYSTGFFGDIIEITYVKDSGASVGSYDIVSFSIDLVSMHNYDLQITDLQDKFIVNRRPVFVSADPITIQYGDPSEALTYQVAEPEQNSGLVSPEELNGEIVKLAGSNAGVYPITAGSLTNDNNPNYDINFTGANYTITKVAVTVTPNPITVEYGDPEQPLTYNLSRELIGSDVLEGDIEREDTIQVGIYEITQGTLIGNEERNINYEITFTTGVNYTITKRALAISPDVATQVYGDAVVDVNYEITEGTLAYTETGLYGILGRSGVEVGTYDITIGTIATLNPNYDITLVDFQNKYTIVRRPITIAANNKTQVYGNTPAQLDYSVTLGSIVQGDTLSGSLTTNAFSVKNVGEYVIFGDNIINSNYDITYVQGTYTITKRPLTVTLTNQETQYTGSEETLIISQMSFEITSGSMAYSETPSTLNVVITKEPGYRMGHYPLTAVFSNSNYSVTFVDAVYIIHKWDSEIITDYTSILFTYDGMARHINAECTSGEEVKFFINETEVNNAFVGPGRYLVTLKADESEAYYAPESVLVTIAIFQDKLITEANGIDATMITEDGFEPELILNMEKADTNSKEIQDHISRYQDVIRSFNLSIIDPATQTVIDKGISSIRIKVPSAVENNEKVIVLVAQNGVYTSYEVDVEDDGYVTITGENITSISFLEETNGNVILYAILGIVALIVLIGFGALLFRKRY